MSTLRYFGGKSYLAPQLRELFPGVFHRYAEPYAGGLSVLLSGDGYNVSEYVNDLDKELINFWHVLRDPVLFKEFKRQVEATPFGKPIFEQANQDYTLPVTRAWAFFIRNRMSRQGLGKDYATPTGRLRSNMNEHVSAWWSSIEGLDATYHRFRKVEIRNQEAIGFIRELDGPQTFFLVDPPYMPETRVGGGYKHEMTVKEHETLLKVLSTIEGCFMLCGYKSDLYLTYMFQNKWQMTTFDTVSNAGAGKVKLPRTEYIWRNY